MAADLADTPSSGLVVQTCGDAHISNFGGFAAPDRRLVFGPNDFDETLPGPWEWDVKRMAASIEIAGRDIDLPARRRRRIVERAVREYREGMREFAQESFLDAWYERLDADELTARFGTKLDAGGHRLLTRTFQRGRRKTSARAVRKLTEVIDGTLRFVSVPPLLTPLHELYDAGPTNAERTCWGCWSSTSTGSTPIASTSSAPTRSPTWPARWSDRQRRHPRMGGPAGRPRQAGRRHAPGQGGPGVGARTAPGHQRIRHPRRAGRARPADDAGGDRHLPRAGSAAPTWKASSATSTCASCGTGRPRPTSHA